MSRDEVYMLGQVGDYRLVGMRVMGNHGLCSDLHLCWEKMVLNAMGEDTWLPIKNPFITLIPNAREYNFATGDIGWNFSLQMNEWSLEQMDGAIKILMSIKNLIAYKLEQEEGK